MSSCYGTSRQPEKKSALSHQPAKLNSSITLTDVLSLAGAFMLIDNLNIYELELYEAQVAPLVSCCQSCHLDQEVLPSTNHLPMNITAVKRTAV